MQMHILQEFGIKEAHIFTNEMSGSSIAKVRTAFAWWPYGIGKLLWLRFVSG